ncbi:MAG TPA: AAA family ATPase, partial [Candidatus Krumholzibacteria bacterium]
MLIELRLKNMAVVADAQLHMGPGLQLLTGSTGAGKSIVVEALRWLRGERIDRSLLRAGTAMASAEALFDLHERPAARARLSELGMDLPEDGFLRVRRELRANGRSVAYLGTQQTSAGVLAGVIGELVVLQSQHQQLALLNPSRHVELLDAAGVSRALVEDYSSSRDEYFDCQRRADEFRAQRARIESERDLLEYQRRELDAAGLRDGESAELLQLVQRLSGGAKLLAAVARAHEALSDDESGVIPQLGHAASELNVADGILELEEAAEQLVAARELSDDAARTLERFLGSDELDPRALD